MSTARAWASHESRMVVVKVGDEWVHLSPEDAQQLSNELQDAVGELDGQGQS